MPKGKVLTVEAFWAKAIKQPNGCWEWTGCLTDSGYGLLTWAGKRDRAHRIAYRIFNKRSIPAGLFVCHKCDNRKCINPEHLFLGTNYDNVMDMVSKGRDSLFKNGREAGNRKFTPEQVKEIRSLYPKLNTVELAKIYRVANSTISYIVNGKQYKNI